MAGSNITKKIKKRKKDHNKTSTTVRTTKSRPSSSSSSSSSASDADSGRAGGAKGPDVKKNGFASEDLDVEMEDIIDTRSKSVESDDKMEYDSDSGLEARKDNSKLQRSDSFASLPGTDEDIDKMADELDRSVNKMTDELKKSGKMTKKKEEKISNMLSKVNLDRMAILSEMGARKIAALKKEVIVTPDRTQNADVYNVTDLRNRQAFALKWATVNGFNAIDRNVKIGKSVFRVTGGTGCKIDPAPSRTWLRILDSKIKIKEAPATYHELFSNIKLMGKDVNAATLCDKAGVESINGDKLSDRQIAGMLLYLMNNTKELSNLNLSSLTFHLSKVIAIFGISELARGFMADKPYDANIFIKFLLKKITNGDGETLVSAFYSGDESSFPGAPEGGAQVLKNPLSSEAQLNRLFKGVSDDPKEFKKLVEEVASMVKFTPKKLTADELKKMDEAEQADYRKAYEEITDTVEKIVTGVDDAVTGTAGELAKFTDMQKELDNKLRWYSSRINSLTKALPDKDQKKLIKDFDDKCERKKSEVVKKIEEIRKIIDETPRNKQ